MVRHSARIARGALIAVFFLSACATRAPETAAAPSVPQNDTLNATLWMQNAVEYKATTLAIYQLAKIRLDAALADKKWTAVPERQKDGYKKQPTAIILDCDETVLDNSVFQASLIKSGEDYTEELWQAYVNSESSRAIPGAVAFTQYAASKGVKVFFVTNRSAPGEAATASDLKRLGFPMGGDVDTLLTKNERPEWTSKKGTRVQHVADDYRVLLLLGDNLGDFTDDYYGLPEKRLGVYEANMAHWGKDWIALPNPAYGSWESAPFEGNFKLSADERRQKKIDTLEGFEPKK